MSPELSKEAYALVTEFLGTSVARTSLTAPNINMLYELAKFALEWRGREPKDDYEFMQKLCEKYFEHPDEGENAAARNGMPSSVVSVHGMCYGNIVVHHFHLERRTVYKWVECK